MNNPRPLQLPIGPSKNDPSPLIIYHGRSCPDGFAAALAAWLFFDGKAEFVGLDHGDIKSVNDLPALAGRAVYILDFSFAPELLRAIDERAAQLVLLDHHKSAADALQDFHCRNGLLHFDLAKSGARLAWEFFLPERVMPDLVRYVEDRDIWTWQYPESADFLAVLDMEPLEFARWNQIASFDATELSDYLVNGRAMESKFQQLAADIARAARTVNFNGVPGLMVNAPGVFHSTIGDAVSRQSGTFALLWCVDKSGAIKIGLRSQRDFDCIPLVQTMHGGGHPQACGFKMAPARLPELLSGTFVA